MKQVVIAAAVALAAVPAGAQDTSPDTGSEVEEGFGLLEEGTRLLLRGLLAEMEPALREMQEALRSLDAYHPPEILPNGDIIIRRKTPLPPAAEPGENGEIEL